MKSFGLLVTMIAMLIVFPGKVYSQSRDCNIEDVEDCFIAIENPNIPPTKKYCDEFKQHIDCICFYKQHYFKVGDTVHACHIAWNAICPLS